jgi:hypothetical protein
MVAASLVILVGIWRGVGPEVILLRALVAAVVCGIVARSVRAALIHLAKAE